MISEISEAVKASNDTSNEPLPFLMNIRNISNNETNIHKLPKLPLYIQNILAINGFDDVITFANITEDQLLHVQEFARNDLLEIVAANPQDKAKYYGLFQNNPVKFQFLAGIKSAIFSIRDVCKSILASTAKAEQFRNKLHGASREEAKESVSRKANNKGSAEETPYAVSIKLHEESLKVTKMAKNYMRDQIQKSEHLSSNEKEAIIQKTCNFDLKVSLNDQDVVCRVKCILCETVSQVMKYKSTGSSRWVMSNFYKHFNIHMAKADFQNQMRKSSTKLRTNSIQDYFKKSLIGTEAVADVGLISKSAMTQPRTLSTTDESEVLIISLSSSDSEDLHIRKRQRTEKYPCNTQSALPEISNSYERLNVSESPTIINDSPTLSATDSQLPGPSKPHPEQPRQNSPMTQKSSSSDQSQGFPTETLNFYEIQNYLESPGVNDCATSGSFHNVPAPHDSIDMKIQQIQSKKCSRKTVKNQGIQIEKDSYYAVYYDSQWYLGRIAEINDGSLQIKFMKQKSQSFFWPKRADIQNVAEGFIISGPIKLIGNEPYKISEQDRNSIVKKFQDMKKQTS